MEADQQAPYFQNPDIFRQQQVVTCRAAAGETVGLGEIRKTDIAVILNPDQPFTAAAVYRREILPSRQVNC